MSRSSALASRIREVYLDGKWIANTNLKEQLLQTDWLQASKKVGNLNTIAALSFHLNYYLEGLLKVIEEGRLEMSDKFSFDMPPISNENDWNNLRERVLDNAEKFAAHVEQMSDEQRNSFFVDEKYGSWQRNIEGVIEHSYYHLGQVTLIRKIMPLS